MSKLAYRHLYNPRVSELQRAIKESEAELKKLKEMTDEQAHKLQDVVVAKEVALKELNEIKQKESHLLSLEDKVGKRVKEAESSLEQAIEKKRGFIRSVDERNRKGLSKIREQEVILNKKSKDVKAELEAKVAETVNRLSSLQESSQSELIELEARKSALKERVKVLTENEKEYQERIKTEIKLQSEKLEESKVSNEREIESSVIRKKQIEKELNTLTAELQIGKGIKVLSSELKNSREKAQKQIAEYNKEVKDINSELKGLISKRDIFEAELKSIKSQNEDLVIRNKSLEARILEAQNQLKAEEGKEQNVLESIKREQLKETERLKSINDNIGKLTSHIEGLKPIAKELKGFIEKSVKAKEEYLAVQTKLNIALKVKDTALKEAEASLNAVAKEKQELSSEKQYFQDFYGKIATYVRVAKETIAEINKELEGKATIEFEIPPNIEKTKVNINNFTEIYET